MALIKADRVFETTTTTGTGALTLAGAITGYRTFGSVCANNDTAHYAAWAVDGSGVPTGAWETGLGTWATGGTFTRTTVHASSNAGAAVSFAAGTKRVALTVTAVVFPAGDLVGTTATQVLSGKTLTDPTITGTIKEDVFPITDVAGFTIDPTNGSIQTITLASNRTPVAANWDNGEAITMMVDSAGFAITWTTVSVTWVGGVAPTLVSPGQNVIQLWKTGGVVYGVYVGIA